MNLKKNIPKSLTLYVQLSINAVSIFVFAGMPHPLTNCSWILRCAAQKLRCKDNGQIGKVHYCLGYCQSLWIVARNAPNILKSTTKIIVNQKKNYTLKKENFTSLLQGCCLLMMATTSSSTTSGSYNSRYHKFRRLAGACASINWKNYIKYFVKRSCTGDEPDETLCSGMSQLF